MLAPSRPCPCCLPRLLLAVLVLAVVGSGPAAVAGVVVVANRFKEKVDFGVARTDGELSPYSLEPGDLVPIPVDGPVAATFEHEGATQRRLLDADCVYYFILRNGKFDLIKVLFSTKGKAATAPPAAVGGVRIESVATIPVMILVDDDEPAVQAVWEKRLRERLAEASDVFEHYCRIRFEPVAVGTWTSDNRITDFNTSLREFETNVSPAPARLAIGFTSQYAVATGQLHLGGTRGVLASHVLIRESARRISKTERLEILIHELGHFLGAMHSPEAISVMRPKIGDHRSSAVDFRIGFDAANTLVMNLIGEELRTRRVRSLADLRPDTKVRAREVYAALAELQPKDPAGKQFLEAIDRSPSVQPAPARPPASLAQATATVVRAVTAAARENRAATAPAAPLTGDRLTEFYVRRAAAAAARLPSDRAAKALLLGLGIALDRSNALRNSPIVGSLCRQVETAGQVADRLKVIGTPTMRGRYDLAQHFTVSSALTALVGEQATEIVGLTKELADSRQGTGFSFADLAADLAGTRFAGHVADGKVSLTRLAAAFTVDDYMPPTDRLPEGMDSNEFSRRYGSTEDDRYRQQREAIGKQISTLPGYGATDAQ